MKIVFFGNTKYSVIGAKIICKIFPIALIVTKKLDFNPVKSLAKEFNIPVIETNTLDEDVVEKIKKVNPDFLIVEDFGLILPKELLSIPKYAGLNIHHSLLPKYRGPSPAPSAILAGDKTSGVSIIRIIEQVDAGDILAQEEYTLSKNETTDSLLIKLNQLGGQLLKTVTNQYLNGSIKPIPQDHQKATYTKRFTKEDGYFDIKNPPVLEILDRMTRAYYPWPGVWTLWEVQSAKGKVKRIVKFLPNNMMQMEGKKAMPMQDFLNGYPEFPIKGFKYLTAAPTTKGS